VRIPWHRHKHSYKFTGRPFLDCYGFKCECGDEQFIYPYVFWYGHGKNPAAEWLWKNA
jgi:hypothetical protein